MSGVDPGLAGRTFAAGGPFAVGREQVRAFAAAVGADHPWHHDLAEARAAGHADLVAPPTFAVVVAQRADAALFADPTTGIALERVVHGEQSLTHHRPIVAGDELTAAVHVDAVRALGGASMVTTRTEVTGAAGEPVCTAASVLVVGAAP